MEVGLIGSDHEICGCMIGIEIVFFFGNFFIILEYFGTFRGHLTFGKRYREKIS